MRVVSLFASRQWDCCNICCNVVCSFVCTNVAMPVSSAVVFIDIGDEQSIEDDLSTYSSHLTNMKIMMKNCNERSLILIDEFGGGTRATNRWRHRRSRTETFNQKLTFGVITTHYQNLKHFAEDHEGVVNGAMLYDRHLMQALFQLQIGNPGSSFAVEMPERSVFRKM